MVLKPQSLSPSDTLPPGKTTPSKPCQMCQHLGWVIGGQYSNVRDYWRQSHLNHYIFMSVAT